MIELNNIDKSYGKEKVLNDLSLTIDSGKITVLVGKNGSGKSTLIRIMAGLVMPDSGDVTLANGLTMGVMLGGDVNLYNKLTGREIIEFFGQLRGMSSACINKRIDEMDEILDLSEFINKRAYTFSRGMRQKIALTISVIHNPDIILLDEPSTGLDIEAVNDVIRFLKYLKSDNKTIFIASHNVFEISDLSDSIAFLKNGKINKKVSTDTFFENCPSAEKSKCILHEI